MDHARHARHTRNGRRGRLLVAAAVGALAIGLAGTVSATTTPIDSAPADTTTGTATEGTVVDRSEISIGLITKTETNPFFVKMREDAAEKAEAEGVELIALAGAFDGDNEGQVAAIEDLISRQVDGIMITPSNSTGILDAVQRARDEGIIVVALDTETDPVDAVDATFATDNFEAGRLQGAYVRAALEDADPRLIMMDGTPGGTVDQQRHDGFLEGFGIEEGDPAIVGAEATNGDQNTAQQAMENLLQRDSDINAVYTINEPAARGAYAALEAAGIAEDVVIGSIDGGCQGVQDVADGLYAATVMQFPGLMVEQGIDAVIGYVETGEAPSGFNNTGAVLITDVPVEGLDSETTEWGLENCWG